MIALLKLFSIDNIKTYLIVIGIIFAVWFFKDYEHQKSENKRQSENNTQLRKLDSLNYSKQVLSDKELIEYLDYQNKNLKSKIVSHGIKLNRLEGIISQQLRFKDTVRNEIKVEGLVDAVISKTPLKVSVIDSTECLIVKGFVVFDGKEINLNITDREFKNVSDVVSYWERNQWSVLGLFKTRIFGKKSVTVKVFNSCGETKTVIIKKK